MTDNTLSRIRGFYLDELKDHNPVLASVGGAIVLISGISVRGKITEMARSGFSALSVRTPGAVAVRGCALSTLRRGFGPEFMSQALRRSSLSDRRQEPEKAEVAGFLPARE